MGADRPRIRPGIVRIAALALAAGTIAGCGGADPARVEGEARAALGAGDAARAEGLLRGALEEHPHHRGLLLLASRLYQSPGAGGETKARLSLHYALRAAAAGTAPDPEALGLACRAFALAGRWEEARRACARASREGGGEAAAEASRAVEAERVPEPRER